MKSVTNLSFFQLKKLGDGWHLTRIFDVDVDVHGDDDDDGGDDVDDGKPGYGWHLTRIFDLLLSNNLDIGSFCIF